VRGTDIAIHPLVFTGVPLAGDHETGGARLVAEYNARLDAHWGQLKVTLPAPLDVMPMPG